MKTQRAFTLVELLVVVAIIAIIVSLLLPALRNARLAGQSGACLSNMHQVAMAGNMYAFESKGLLPPYAPYYADDPGIPILLDHGTGVRVSPSGYRRMYLVTTWFRPGPYSSVPRAGDGFFGRYLNTGMNLENTPIMPDGSIGGLRFIVGCPSIAVGPERAVLYSGGVRFETFVYRACSYGVNWGDGAGGGIFDTDDQIGPPTGGVGGYELADLPARMVMMADGTGEEPYLVWTASWPHEQHTARTPAPRHVDNFNAAFLDGHAKSGTTDVQWNRDYFLNYD